MSHLAKHDTHPQRLLTRMIGGWNRGIVEEQKQVGLEIAVAFV